MSEVLEVLTFKMERDEGLTLLWALETAAGKCPERQLGDDACALHHRLFAMLYPDLPRYPGEIDPPDE